MLTARDIMTERLVTIQPACSVRSAIELLIQEQISGLPVVDGSGQLVGIVTEFALLATAYDESIAEETVEKHMTTEVLTVNVDDPVRKMADLFIVHRVRRVPVMDRGRIVGLIARRDVLKAVYESKVGRKVRVAAR
jgi:predicted transcriptional regulator